MGESLSSSPSNGKQRHLLGKHPPPALTARSCSTPVGTITTIAERPRSVDGHVSSAPSKCAKRVCAQRTAKLMPTRTRRCTNLASTQGKANACASESSKSPTPMGVGSTLGKVRRSFF
ncbi:transposase [Anopheles sinensis]|uniref:Transposase n=1 Tax=Anopheles sinensis TaxID=74873 RepID=A0A084VYP2_ANOSI|nr:transposase [Anopheles sinensis]